MGKKNPKETLCHTISYLVTITCPVLFLSNIFFHLLTLVIVSVSFMVSVCFQLNHDYYINMIISSQSWSSLYYVHPVCAFLTVHDHTLAHVSIPTPYVRMSDNLPP